MNENLAPWFLTIIIPALLWLALVISALWNISRNNMSSSVKVLWYIIIIFAPFIGSIIYWVWGKNKQF
ncbi:PLDc N-terminal domain-containing protein [Pedobacter nototheniae]|uniref:PLDc N-terminal domain-containing protein n=1 Tax=Pedobacter nototheniae TaxID=2488994 RepID=UPI0029305737|nr:PLDc N-terminal domain-containing protein [Pedobacter nototheniae]